MKPEAPPDTVELEDLPCPIGCAPDDRLVVEGHDRLHGIPGRYRIVRCAYCGLMRTNPRPTPLSIGAYYPADYGPYAVEQPRPLAGSALPACRARMRRLLGFEVRRLPPIPAGRLLEIGCASGSWLAEVRRAGWDVEGIEFSDTAARQARALGLRVQTASVETAHKPTAPIDAVVAWMVLEHLHDPHAALRRLHQWTREGGWLVASVPDANALTRTLFGEHAYDLHLPNHLYHYTTGTLRILLRTCGWQIDRVFWQRNPNNLLWSFEYLAGDRGWTRRLAVVRWLRCAAGAGRLRMLLGWLLGVTRQSGRIEIWARRISDEAGSD